MAVKTRILDIITRVAAEQERRISKLTDETVLTDSGLDSLCFAIIVARLEDELGVDPFSQAEEIPFPRTVGDLVALYDRGAE